MIEDRQAGWLGTGCAGGSGARAGLRGGQHPPWVVRVRHLGRVVLVAGARGWIVGWVPARDAGAGVDCLEAPVRVALCGRLVR